MLQRHYPYMLDMLRFRIASRAEFERLKAQAPETLTDLERAARFLYLQKLAFGGKVAGRGFGVDNRQGARFNVARLEPLLADIHERLAGVTIEQMGYGEFAAFRMIEAETTYTVAAGAGVKAAELIISNFN